MFHSKWFLIAILIVFSFGCDTKEEATWDEGTIPKIEALKPRLIRVPEGVSTLGTNRPSEPILREISIYAGERPE
ncbi:MAG: hypothetical protein KC931_23745, partial [Candidatus Omnitrophica bacterium]|nr:hypothetical protein [Candidatus Omnitrophota bacterium]